MQRDSFERRAAFDQPGGRQSLSQEYLAAGAADRLCDSFGDHPQRLSGVGDRDPLYLFRTADDSRHRSPPGWTAVFYVGADSVFRGVVVAATGRSSTGGQKAEVRSRRTEGRELNP